MGDRTKISVSKDVRDKLRMLKVATGKEDYDSLLEDMIKIYVKAKCIKIIVEVNESN